jgi:hypothetical protein
VNNGIVTDEHGEILWTVERAVDQHKRLVRASHASLVFTRHEPKFTVTIDARVRGSRKKPVAIHGGGSSPEEAGKRLIEQLDAWAETLS